MANRRMVSKTITQKQRFLQLPLDTQALYFHLIQNSDDDGIVEAFPVLRMIGASDDSLGLLVVRKFIKPLNDEMVYFVVDFFEQNTIQKNHYKKSIYQHLLNDEDKKMNPRIEENQRFENTQQNVDKMLTNCRPNIIKDNQRKENQREENQREENQREENQMKDRLVDDSDSQSQKNTYLFDFDELTSTIKIFLSNVGYYADITSDDFLENATDEEFIAGLTYYSFDREPDTYEINTIKKQLSKFERLLVKEIYKQANLYEADSVAYITKSLQNLEKENTFTLEEWERQKVLSVKTESE
ncbi:TPA: DNA replication protein DnaD [Streptococcus suis]